MSLGWIYRRYIEKQIRLHYSQPAAAQTFAFPVLRRDGVIKMSHLAPRLVFRPLIRSSTPTRLQRRHARVHDVRFVTTHQQSGTVQEKYRAKLEEKAKA
jgi:hypothetical protein